MVNTPETTEKTLLKYLRTGILVLTRKFDVLYINPAAEKLLNVSSPFLKENKKLSIDDIFTQKEAGIVRLWVDNTRRHSNAFLEIKKDGRVLRFVAHPIVEGRNDLGTIVEIIDVTSWTENMSRQDEFVNQLAREITGKLSGKLPPGCEDLPQEIADEIHNLASWYLTSAFGEGVEFFELSTIVHEMLDRMSSNLKNTAVFHFIPAMLPPVLCVRSALEKGFNFLMRFVIEQADTNHPLIFAVKPSQTGKGLGVLISYALFLKDKAALRGDTNLSRGRAMLEKAGGEVEVLTHTNGSACITTFLPASQSAVA